MLLPVAVWLFSVTEGLVAAAVSTGASLTGLTVMPTVAVFDDHGLLPPSKLLMS